MSNKEALIKLINLLNKYRRTILIIVICLLFSTILSLCIPLLDKKIMDDGFIGGNKKQLVNMVLLCACIHGINSLIDIIKEKKRVDILSKIQYYLAEESFKHLMRLRISYFNNINHAEILNNLNMDISNISSIADESLFFVVTKVFSMVGGTIGLFIIDYRLTLLVLIFIPVKYFSMKYFAKKNKNIMNEFIKSSEEYANWFGDCTGGIKEVKMFGLLSSKYNEFKEKQMKLVESYKQLNIINQYNNITDNIMIQFLIIILYIVGADLIFDMKLSIGSIFAFITYSTYVTGPISSILNIGYFLGGIIPSTKRYYEFMYIKEEEYNKSEKIHFGDIELINVNFSYENKNKILKDINAIFPKFSKTALVGKNGSGKSTFINLLTRLYDPESGQILLNKKNISCFSIENYRENISVVSQQIYLFNDTIRNNISLYKEIDDDDIKKACFDSGLEEFLNKCSLDYIVGDNGKMLSGGQKQKIALARAIIHDKPILILDEATSNTDVYSEMQINKLLNTRFKDKTVIIISHKKDILKRVDNIIFLENGKIIGDGSYEKLYSENVKFREMISYGE